MTTTKESPSPSPSPSTPFGDPPPDPPPDPPHPKGIRPPLAETCIGSDPHGGSGRICDDWLNSSSSSAAICGGEGDDDCDGGDPPLFSHIVRRVENRRRLRHTGRRSHSDKGIPTIIPSDDPSFYFRALSRETAAESEAIINCGGSNKIFARVGAPDESADDAFIFLLLSEFWTEAHALSCFRRSSLVSSARRTCDDALPGFMSGQRARRRRIRRGSDKNSTSDDEDAENDDGASRLALVRTILLTGDAGDDRDDGRDGEFHFESPPPATEDAADPAAATDRRERVAEAVVLRAARLLRRGRDPAVPAAATATAGRAPKTSPDAPAAAGGWTTAAARAATGSVIGSVSAISGWAWAAAGGVGSALDYVLETYEGDGGDRGYHTYGTSSSAGGRWRMEGRRKFIDDDDGGNFSSGVGCDDEDDAALLRGGAGASAATGSVNEDDDWDDARMGREALLRPKIPQMTDVDSVTPEGLAAANEAAANDFVPSARAVAETCRGILRFARSVVGEDCADVEGGDDWISFEYDGDNSTHDGGAVRRIVLFRNGNGAGTVAAFCRAAGKYRCSLPLATDGRCATANKFADETNEQEVDAAAVQSAVGRILSDLSPSGISLLARTLVASGHAVATMKSSSMTVADESDCTGTVNCIGEGKDDGDDILTLFPRGDIPFDWEPTGADRALLRLRSAQMDVRNRMVRLEREAEQAGRNALIAKKRLGASSSKSTSAASAAALAHLRQRKAALDESERCARILANIDAGRLRLERAASDARVAKSFVALRSALQEANESLSNEVGGVGKGVERMDNLMEDLREEMEYIDDVGDALVSISASTVLPDVDKDKLEEEFQKLQLQVKDEKEVKNDAKRSTLIRRDLPGDEMRDANVATEEEALAERRVTVAASSSFGDRTETATLLSD